MSESPHHDAESAEDTTRVIVTRALRRFHRWQAQVHERTDRIFERLFVGQWLFAVAISVWLSPYTWNGAERALHPHILAALCLGLGIIVFPVFLIRTQPGAALTRYVVAVAQMLLSALLIHVTGGRIETHFHVFGSLAFLAFYLDWRVLVIGAATTSLDHLIRGFFYPESIYGVENTEWWRFMEHGAWVAFCLAFLVHHAVTMLKSWLRFAEESGMLEAMAESEWRARSVLAREQEERQVEERSA